jgi:hypothetical protein
MDTRTGFMDKNGISDEWEDTSDSEEADLPESRRRRRTMVSDDVAMVSLSGTVLKKHDIRCFSVPVLSTQTKVGLRRKKEQTRRNKNPGSIPSLSPLATCSGLLEFDKVRDKWSDSEEGKWVYPCLENWELYKNENGDVQPITDFHSISDIVHNDPYQEEFGLKGLSIDDENFGSDIYTSTESRIDPLSHENLDKRVEEITKSGDAERRGLYRSGALPNPMTSVTDGYVTSLTKTTSSHVHEMATSVLDASVMDALSSSGSSFTSFATREDLEIPIDELDNFYSNVLGNADVLNDVEMMCKSISYEKSEKPEKSESPNLNARTSRRQLIEDVILNNFSADTDYRKWGSCKDSIKERLQWMGARCDSRYIDDYLRAPIPSRNERACIRGAKCFGNILPCVKSFPRTAEDVTHTPGFTLREFELPLHQIAKTQSSESRPFDATESIKHTKTNKVGGSCILCIMLKQTLKVWQVAQRGQPWPYQIQYFEVAVGPPYGYTKDRLLPEVLQKSGVETGIVSPTLGLVIDDYHLSTTTKKDYDGHDITVPCYLQTARHFSRASVTQGQ